MPSATVVSDTDADAYAAALGPELRRDLPRTRTEVRCGGGRVSVRIAAADTASLRAAVNSVLECMAVVKRMNTIAKGKK